MKSKIEQMWGMKATTIPVVIGALGLVKKGMEKFTQQIPGNIKYKSYRRSHYLEHHMVIMLYYVLIIIIVSA